MLFSLAQRLLACLRSWKYPVFVGTLLFARLLASYNTSPTTIAADAILKATRRTVDIPYLTSLLWTSSIISFCVSLLNMELLVEI